MSVVADIGLRGIIKPSPKYDKIVENRVILKIITIVPIVGAVFSAVSCNSIRKRIVCAADAESKISLLQIRGHYNALALVRDILTIALSVTLIVFPIVTGGFIFIPIVGLALNVVVVGIHCYSLYKDNHDIKKLKASIQRA